ncbi:MAG: GAF domain-containing protein [gamma proteobacterium symbiont of Bathyaustriella thionipta]|nr:GAF domain-containing protein [gamma proteobacterium symbiont of Bathyaustriella thionipta]MCU7951141.1 GAF domain-containing protein [gamma proteobacterium symbiont of Bathyaustriella thionipta]MCU7952104.1 GAF domain-containing protein [gamma proteobacterium symbiont of Bathyaustriella thionipta]MCU7967200.1 GAF domain-containing protein [gamma proteobacterium symbiont of Bathyaustriella thionipta]
MHRPNKYDDPLFDTRPTIKEANTKMIEVKGFEEGRIFNAYRFVFPVIFNDKHFGSVELSVSMNAIINYMKEISKSEYCFMIKKLVVSDSVFDDEKTNYEQSVLSEWYLHDKTINNDYCTNKVASSLESIKSNHRYLSDIENSNKFVASVVQNKKIYSALFLPIKNTKKRNVAYLFSIENDPLFKQFKVNFVSKILLTLISTFSFVLLLFFMFSRNKIITSKTLQLEEQIEKKSAALNISQKNEQRDIIFFNIIKAINKKVLCNTPLDEVLKFCVNRFMILPSCTFSVISVDLEEEYLFFSDACDRFESAKTEVCDMIFKLVKNSNHYSDSKPVIINDLSDIQELAGYIDVFEENQVRTIVFLPLIEEMSKKIFGHVIFFSARTECFDENERQLFSELAQSISFAINFNQMKNVATVIKKKNQHKT